MAKVTFQELADKLKKLVFEAEAEKIETVEEVKEPKEEPKDEPKIEDKVAELEAKIAELEAKIAELEGKNTEMSTENDRLKNEITEMSKAPVAEPVKVEHAKESAAIKFLNSLKK